MNKTQIVEAAGVVLENLPNTMFRVKVGDAVVLCTLAGRIRLNWVRLLPCDRVRCEVSTLDSTKGRIVYKIK